MTIVACATVVSALPPIPANRRWALASYAPAGTLRTTARYVVMPLSGAHDCTASDVRMIVTTSPTAVFPASALNVFPHVAGRDTIAMTLSPCPEIDPVVGTMPGKNELVTETASPEGGDVTDSRSPDEHPANASAEINKRYRIYSPRGS